MDNFKLISNVGDEHVPSNQLISEKTDNRELGIEQVGNTPYKNASASMLEEVTNHFKTTFSNVSKGEASTSEYLEVGTLAVGTAALAAVGVGKLMQRTFPTLKSTVAEEGFFIPKNPSAHAIPIERLLRASESLPHSLSSRTVAGSTSIGRSEAAISPIGRSEAAIFPVKPINRATPPGPQADFDRMINADWNVPVKERFLAMTNDKLPGLVSRLEGTPSNKLTLNLQGSQISDDGLVHLLPLTRRIKELNLAGTRITEDGKHWLIRNFPRTGLIVPGRAEMAKNAALKALETGSK